MRHSGCACISNQWLPQLCGGAPQKDLQRAYSQLNRYKPAGATSQEAADYLAAARKDLPLIAAFVNCLPDGGEDLAAAALACLSQTAASNLFNTIAGDNAIGISLAIDPLGTLLGEFYSLGQGVANTAVSVAMALKGDSGKGIVTGVTYGAKWGFSCMWRTRAATSGFSCQRTYWQTHRRPKQTRDRPLLHEARPDAIRGGLNDFLRWSLKCCHKVAKGKGRLVTLVRHCPFGNATWGDSVCTNDPFSGEPLVCREL